MARQRDPRALFAAALSGDRVSLARLLSLVEEAGDAADETDELVRVEQSGRSAGWVLGVTGAPGAGKSTLTDRIVDELRRPFEGGPLRVAVLCVDPSSPKTGGALLGDRIRMGGHGDDEGVFIRSVATRGAGGGLAGCIPIASRLLQVMGFGAVIVETVGVGQVELDVASLADTVLVVLNPGWGDEVQAVKAGLMEIADVFAVNKADRTGAAETIADVEATLSLGDRHKAINVHGTCALTGEGVSGLVDSLRTHSKQAANSDTKVRRELEIRMLAELQKRLAEVLNGDEGGELMRQVTAGEVTVAAAAAKLQGRFWE